MGISQEDSPISTIREKCRICYACVRNCPTKAIGIFNDYAEIIPHRCIGCGKCIQVCSQNAKVLADAITATEQLLQADEPAVAVLGCSFTAFFHDVHPGRMVSALKLLGFDEVLEGASGVELIAPEYRKVIENHTGAPLLASHCPTIVDLIERHYPQLLKNLVPVVSPMIATGRNIKAQRKEKVRVVYISSCIGGKFEIQDDPVLGAIDTVLTYSELKMMLSRNNIDPQRLKIAPMDGKPSSNGRSFSIIGGPFHNFGIQNNGLDPNYISTVGEENSLEIIRDLAAGRITPRYVDVRFCKGGCICGPSRTNRLTSFSKGNLIIEYQKQEITYQTAEHYQPGGSQVSLDRTFSNKYQQLDRPSGETIKKILQETDKFTEQDELNCGSCGYATCREHAVAVYQGLADNRMCLPYSIHRLQADRSKLEQKYELAKRALNQEYGNNTIIGNDQHTQGVLHMIQQVGPTPTTVLIRGESGTGKEMTARSIHEASQRIDKPMVTVNCTTLTDNLLESELFGHIKGSFTGAFADKKGLFETADGGTIFLDEIGDITPKLQAELLRVLDNGEIKPVGSNKIIKVDVRIIAATNKNLEDGVSKGWFREDLFYRLNVFAITLAPLRNRISTIPLLIDYFLKNSSLRLNKQIDGIDPEAQKALIRYPWPGNIRELQNIIERAIVLAQDRIIHMEQLPMVISQLAADRISASPQTPEDRAHNLKNQHTNQVEKLEKEMTTEFLQAAGGNVSAAAKLAGIPRRTFYRMLQRNGVNPNSYRR